MAGNGSEIARAFVTIVPSMKDAQKTISEELGAAAQSAGKDAGEKLGDGISENIGKALGKTGALDSINKISQMVGDTIGQIGEKALGAAKELDTGYDTIISKTGATGKQFEEFKDIANNIFGDLPEDMDTVGAAVGEVNTRFKLTGDQLEKTSTKFVKFAKVNNTDVSNAIDDVQNAMAAFNVSGKDTDKVLDALTKTGQNTGADVANLSKKVIENATAFQQMGMDIYGSIQFMGQLETAGADSASVMSGMKRALKSATEEGIPLNQALADLQDTILNGTGATDGLTEAYDLFGKSGAGVYEAVKNGQIDFKNLADSTQLLNDATGALDDTYEQTLDGWDKMTVATNNLKIAGAELTGAFFEAAAPAIDGLTGFVKDLTQGFQELPEEVQGVIGVIGAIGIEAAKVIPQIIEFATQLATLKVMKELSGDATGLSGGIGGLKNMLMNINPIFIAVAAAIAAAVAVFAAFKADVEANTEAVKAFKAETAALYESATETVAGVQELATAETTAENAAQNLAQAQANLQTLQSQGAEAAAKAAEAEQLAVTETTAALESAVTATMAGNVELSTFGQIINGVTNGAYGMAVSVKTAQERYDEYTASAEKANAAAAETEAALQLATNEVAKYTLLSSDMTEMERQKTEALLNTVDMTNTSAEEYQAFCDDIAAVNTAHRETINALADMRAGYETELATVEAELEAYQESATNTLDSVFGMFNNVTVEVDQSVTDMIAALDSQIAYMDNYQANITAAMDMGVDKGLIQKLSDGSVESAKILQAIVNDGEENIEKLNEKFQNVEEGKNNFTTQIGEAVYDFSGRMDEIKNKLDTTISAMNEADQMYLVGAQTVNGYIQGMNSMEGSLQATASRLAAIPQQVTRAINAIKSPSRVMAQLGEYTGQGYVNGIAKMIKPVANASKAMAKATITATKQEIKKLTTGNSNDYAKAAEKLMTKMNDSINNALTKDSAKLTKQVKRYFERYELNLEKEQNALQKQINRLPSDSKATKQQKQQKKALEKELNQLKNYSAKFKKVQSQLGGNIAKSLTESLEKQTSKITTTLTNKVNNYAKTMQEKIDAVNDKISSMRENMAGYGTLFENKEEGLLYGGVRQYTQLTDLKGQIKTLKTYRNNLNSIKGKVADSLMQEITSMSVDDAINYTSELLKMSATELTQYNKLWKQKQRLAKNTANDFYAQEIAEIKTKYTDKIQQAFKDAQTKIKDFGAQALKGFIKGMKSVDVDLAIAGSANKIIAAFKKALKINSPSKVFAEMGVYSMEGLIDGVQGEEKAVANSYKNMADVAISAYAGEMENLTANIPTVNTKIYDFTSRLQTQGVTPYSPAAADVQTAYGTAAGTPITVNVYGAQGQDVNALANIVIQKINQKIQTREAAYA